MRIPRFIIGALVGPLLIGFVLVLRTLCSSPEATCFADHFAVPVFLPLIFVYKMTEGTFILGQELGILMLYWSVIGLMIGFILDLHNRRS